MKRELAFILVGDHLGQVKKVLLPSGEISTLAGCGAPSSSSSTVSIGPIKGSETKQLIAKKNGQLYLYDCAQDTIREIPLKASDELNEAVSITEEKIVLVYDRRITYDGKEETIKQKSGKIKCVSIREDRLGYGGFRVPLRVIDLETKARLYEASPPEKDWLGISPEVYISDLEYVDETRVATCSRSDSVVRVYDTRGKTKPIITVDFDKPAFNEHAEACKFHSIASTGENGHTIVVGSNVGQVFAIDLRFNIKEVPIKKRLKPRTHKVLGSFKGARGSSITDLKLVPAMVPAHSGRDEDDTVEGYRMISCSLDRYVRIYNFSRNNRSLYKHVYMTTKPLCCSPVLYPELC